MISFLPTAAVLCRVRILSRLWYGAVECVDGRLYNFGGLTQYRGTYTASPSLRRFSPADYVPVSVVILPD